MNDAVHVDAGAMKAEKAGAAVDQRHLHGDDGLVGQDHVKSAGHVGADVVFGRRRNQYAIERNIVKLSAVFFPFLNQMHIRVELNPTELSPLC